MFPIDWRIHSGPILAGCKKNSGERCNAFLACVARGISPANMVAPPLARSQIPPATQANASWSKWMIASREELTEKTDFSNFNFIILFLHLRRSLAWIRLSCSLKRINNLRAELFSFVFALSLCTVRKGSAFRVTYKMPYLVFFLCQRLQLRGLTRLRNKFGN